MLHRMVKRIYDEGDGTFTVRSKTGIIHGQHEDKATAERHEKYIGDHLDRAQDRKRTGDSNYGPSKRLDTP